MAKEQSKKRGSAKKSSSSQKGTSSLKKGDKVEWGTSQGKTKGIVKQKVTKAMKIEGHQVKASAKEPQFLVQSEKTGKRAAHQAKALKKVKA